MTDNKLKEENEELKKKIYELEERLKVYTNNNSHKKYYEKNNDIIKEKARNYMNKIKETSYYFGIKTMFLFQ
jgi:cell division protein FtsB